MEVISLQNGEYLGCSIYEITSVPETEPKGIVSDKADNNQEEIFFGLINEIYRFCVPGKAVIEYLWSAQPVNNQLHAAGIHIYIILRMIAADVGELRSRLVTAGKCITARLNASSYQYTMIDPSSLSGSGMLPQAGTYINAVHKAEQCTVHAQSMFPYYYSIHLPFHRTADFSMLSHALADMPGAAVSFQLIPTVITQDEYTGITEMYSALKQVTGGISSFQTGFYRDTMADAALDSMGNLYQHIRQPVFTYNFLAMGNQTQCAALTAQVISLLKGNSDAELSSVNLNAESIDPGMQLMWYPWNLNSRLIKHYRNANLWNQMIISPALFRLPYLIFAEEASVCMQLPRNDGSLAGIVSKTVMRNTQILDDKVSDPGNISFGRFLEDASGQTMIGCPPGTLTRHRLVVGKPGTGKTTFSVNLLLQLQEKGVPFLAVEPTKTEYRAMIDAVPDLQVFTPGKNRVSPFVINPFIPPKGITVEQYIPSLCSAFKAAFSMPSPLDTIFQAAIQEAYVEYGWRDYSTAQDKNVTLFGLHEFILVFRRLISREKYSAEVKGNLTSGGVLRLRNLIEQNANIYDTVHSVPIEELLSKPTVLELNAIDNEEQKSVLMALLLINICVYTKHANAGDGKLKNAILIDEAHVLFKADSGEGSASAVRSLENMLAEIRSYGTSIIIADQSPSAVGSEVVKNTEIKVAFQLLTAEDRRMIASSTNMTDEQEDRISKLGVGEAFICYGLLKEPALVKTPEIRGNLGIRLNVSDKEIAERMNYWDTHAEYLIPFRECSYSNVCKECDTNLRSDAAYYAARFVQSYGAKITDEKSLFSYLKASDRWLDAQMNSEVSDGITGYSDDRLRMHNCCKIRILRRILQMKDITFEENRYQKVLQSFLNRDSRTSGAE